MKLLFKNKLRLRISPLAMWVFSLCVLSPVQVFAVGAVQHAMNLQNSDRTALVNAKNAIISYAIAAGKLPCAVNASGTCVASAAGLMPPSAGAGAVSALGVNNWGAFGSENPFRLDVNDALAATTGMTGYCAAVQGQMSTAGAGPSVNGVAMAFVLYSTGSDHKPNLKNAVADRNYESESQAIDNEPGTAHYDDQLVAVPLASLVAQCGTVDVGAAPVCSIDATPVNISVGESVTLTASATDVPNNCSTCQWSANPASSPLPIQNSSGGAVSPILDTTYTVSASNGFGSCNQSIAITYDPCHASAQACFQLNGNLQDTVSTTNAAISSGGTATYTAQGAGQAFSFNGSTFLYKLLNVSETNYSTSLWFKTTQQGHGIYEVWRSGGGAHDRDLYLDATGNVCAYTYNAQTICSSGTNYADGAYHHLAHVLNGTDQILYIDGAEAVRGNKGFSDFTWQNSIVIGYARFAPTRFFSGEIDNVQIFTKALSPTEVTQLAVAP